MGKIQIRGGKRLNGYVRVHGSKNSILPIMAASLLNSGISIIQNCPNISDVNEMCRILEYLGCVINRDDDLLIIDSCNAVSKPITKDMTGKLRASSVLIGPMLARFGFVKTAQPGGCDIGIRPMDIHLEAMKRLGASWEATEEYIIIQTQHLRGNMINLRFPSVGATENAVMAAVGAMDDTVIYNAAREPEIIHLCAYLEKIGVYVKGAGSSRLVIKGSKMLTDAVYKVPADRIVLGTYMGALAVCKGEIILFDDALEETDCQSNWQECIRYNAELRNAATGFLDVFAGMGLQISDSDKGLKLVCNQQCNNINYIFTGPYPQFPTDMQSIVMSAAAVAKGTMRIKENMFENRFKTAVWLKKMGADIQIKDNTAIIKGVQSLKGELVYGEDLRGTAALVVAGLGAKGTTIIDNADYIKRGYADICENLRELGADIEWKDV